MRKIILLIFFIVTLNAKLGENRQTEAEIKYASISKKDNSWVIEEKFDIKSSIASAKYTVGLESIGWDLLAITTNKEYDDELQAEAAGRLEGYLTKERIYNHWRNLNEKSNWKNSTNMPEYVQEFFNDQAAYIEEIYLKNKTDAISANAFFILKQFKGMIESYNNYTSDDRRINPADFHTMSSFGDLFDVIYYKNMTERPKFNEISTEEVLSFILTNNHCSAIFKVKEDFSDLFFGHNSWFYYSAMTRIFKEYNFNFNHPSVKSRNIIFSSYPATLGSMDDFYITSQDLVVIETTNSLFNNELYSKLTPRSLLCWQRAMIANRVSEFAKDWTENFSKYNSGTYNNMFMALDMKKVNVENNKIDDDAFYIVEQIPGLTEINDVTKYLKLGHWPSYNTPFSAKIKELSHIDEMIKNKPELSHSLDYHTCARANIFRRDQGKATSLEEFKKLIRYNDYLNDPLSLKNPAYAIACRADLTKNCMGAYDAKASSVKLAKGKNKVINIIQGPSHDIQPLFDWTKSNICQNEPRYGLPIEYNYGWYQYKNEFFDEVLYPTVENNKLLEFLE